LLPFGGELLLVIVWTDGSSFETVDAWPMCCEPSMRLEIVPEAGPYAVFGVRGGEATSTPLPPPKALSMREMEACVAQHKVE
jgi:hypothetical protein